MTRPHPQRLFSPSPPGSLLKRTGLSGHSPATAGAAASPQRPRNPNGDADDYLRLVRALPCLHCGMEPCEAAHVRMASAAFGKSSGLGKKPENRFCVPLCAEHHRLGRDAQHNRGEREFWESLGINPLICAAELYAQRGDLVAMRAVVMVTISKRDRQV